MSAPPSNRPVLEAPAGNTRGRPFDDRPGQNRPARRLLAAMRPEKYLLAASFVLAVGSVMLSVVGPRILGVATDLIVAGVVAGGLPGGQSKAEALEHLRRSGDTAKADLLAPLDVVPGQGIDFSAVGRVLLVALLVYLVAAALAYLQGSLTTTVVQRVVRRLREEVQAKLSRLPLSYFDRQPRGEILSRVTNDVDNLAQSLQQTLSQMIISVLTVVGVLGMMLWISPLLALIALVGVPLSTFVAGRIGRLARPRFAEQWAATGLLNGHVEESFSGHILVTAFGRQSESRDAFEQHNQSLYRAGYRAQFLSSLIQPAMIFLSNVNYVLIAVVGALRVASGTLTLGEVQAFVQYSRQFNQPLIQLAGMSALFQSGLASAVRIFEILDAQEESPEPAPTATPASCGGRVQFQDVSFRYAPDKPLIENLTLSVEPGQTVAIVGPTGAGKTTLVNLLMRFYEVTGGQIRLDGVDIATMPRPQLRARTGMVLQDAWLFGGTIADNIAYGAHREVTHEQIVAAARATHVDHFVRTLPQGYDTVLGDDADTISVGERQLITIARAFLAEPAILILDEATSSVDTRTELIIQQAMNRLRQGRTSFVIAHRLSTVRDADLILVMHQGIIVEQGSHTELLTMGGAYADLYAAQFASATDPQLP